MLLKQYHCLVKIMLTFLKSSQCFYSFRNLLAVLLGHLRSLLGTDLLVGCRVLLLVASLVHSVVGQDLLVHDVALGVIAGPLVDGAALPLSLVMGGALLLLCTNPITEE